MTTELPDPKHTGLESSGLLTGVCAHIPQLTPGISTVGQPSPGQRGASQGVLDHFPSVNDAGQKQPQPWIGPSADYQDITMLSSNQPVLNQPVLSYGSEVGHRVPAPGSHAMQPPLAVQAHPPWPCDTSYAPCPLLRLPSTFSGQPVMLFMGYPPAGGSTAGLAPYPGSVFIPLPDQRALNHGLWQCPRPDHYQSPYAATSLPGDTISGSSMPLSTRDQPPSAAQQAGLTASATEPLSALTKGTTLSF